MYEEFKEAQDTIKEFESMLANTTLDKTFATYLYYIVNKWHITRANEIRKKLGMEKISEEILNAPNPLATDREKL